MLGLLTQTCAASTMLVTHFAIAVVAVAASSVLGGSPNLPISPPTSSVGVISPPVTPPTPTPTTMGVSASPPISSTPTLPIGMRRMYDHDYAYPPVPPTMPSASPPVGLPEPVEGLTNSERLARGLPIRGPRLLRVLPGSPLEGCKSPGLLLDSGRCDADMGLQWTRTHCSTGVWPAFRGPATFQRSDTVRRCWLTWPCPFLRLEDPLHDGTGLVHPR